MSFNIIKHRGAIKSGTTAKGVTVKPLAQVFTKEYGMVRVTDYHGEHFIYENPDQTFGTSSFICTCGSAAVIANPYQTGRAFVCLQHATYGFHATSQVNKKDFEQGVPVIRKGRKWA